MDRRNDKQMGIDRKIRINEWHMHFKSVVKRGVQLEGLVQAKWEDIDNNKIKILGMMLVWLIILIK